MTESNVISDLLMEQNSARIVHSKASPMKQNGKNASFGFIDSPAVLTESRLASPASLRTSDAHALHSYTDNSLDNLLADISNQLQAFNMSSQFSSPTMETVTTMTSTPDAKLVQNLDAGYDTPKICKSWGRERSTRSAEFSKDSFLSSYVTPVAALNKEEMAPNKNPGAIVSLDDSSLSLFDVGSNVFSESELSLFDISSKHTTSLKTPGMVSSDITNQCTN